MTFRARPSDDAILAMINSSQKIIRLVLQDLGPVCLPGTKKGLPGLVWPKNYLAAIGKAIYERGVDIEMVLSNPNSIPGSLKGTEANYGNGWDCVDVAAEIIKGIQKQYSDVDNARLRAMVSDNLKICFIRHAKSESYEDGMSIGLHSKHFIVDDTCCYIGSQNLYMCDLAEWGIVVDHEESVKKIMGDYFSPMWKNSYTGIDVDVERVMDALDVDRDGETGVNAMWTGLQGDAGQHMMPHGTGAEYYGVEDDDDEGAAETSPHVDGSPDASREINGISAKDVEEADKAQHQGDDSTVSSDSSPIAGDSTITTSSTMLGGSPIANARDDSNDDQDNASEERVTTVTPPAEAEAVESESTSNAPTEVSTAIVMYEGPEDSTTAITKYEPPKDSAVPEETSKGATEEHAIILKPGATPEAEQKESPPKSQGLQFDCCGIAHSFGIASE